MRIRRFNENKNDDISTWYYQIREIHYEGFYYMDPWEDDYQEYFEEFDWDNNEYDLENPHQDYEFYVKVMIHLVQNYPDKEWHLVKVTIDDIKDERIKIAASANKYNL